MSFKINKRKKKNKPLTPVIISRPLGKTKTEREFLPVSEKKTCKKCEKLLPISEFGKYSYAKDGKQVYCKKCWSKICRKNRHNKLYHDCINLLCELEELAFDGNAEFNELFVLTHMKMQYWKVIDLAWEFSRNAIFKWPSGYKKPEYQKLEYKECTECGIKKITTAFIQGYNVCKLCAKKLQTEKDIHESL